MCRLQAVQCRSGDEELLQTAVGPGLSLCQSRCSGAGSTTQAHAACCRTAGHCNRPTGSAVPAQAAPCMTAHHSVYEALQCQPPLFQELVVHLELLHSVLLRDWRHNDACRQCNSVARGSNSSVWQTQAAPKGYQAQAGKTAIKPTLGAPCGQCKDLREAAAGQQQARVRSQHLSRAV